MTPIAILGPSVEPVSLAAMKSYLRIDGGDEDDLVAALIVAGRLTVERATRLVLIEQTWRLRLATWPPDRAVPLPLHPVMAVDAVRLVTDLGVPQVLSGDLYRLDHDGDPVRLLVDVAAPSPSGRGAAVEIDLRCGFGATAASVPQPLVLALRRLVARWFEHRGDDPQPGGAVPPDIGALIAPFARPRLA